MQRRYPCASHPSTPDLLLWPWPRGRLLPMPEQLPQAQAHAQPLGGHFVAGREGEGGVRGAA